MSNKSTVNFERQVGTAFKGLARELDLLVKSIDRKRLKGCPKASDVWVENKRYLFVQYADGKIKKVDLLEILKDLGDWAQEAISPNSIEKVKLNKYGIPTWPNGFEIDQEAIYEIADDAPQKISARKEHGRNND